MRKDRNTNAKILNAVRPNAGVEVAFRKRLLKELEEMHDSVMYWLLAAYRAHPPRIAQDAVPANELRDALAKLSRQWLYRFDTLAEWLADYFATDIMERSDGALKNALRRAGFSVKFRMSQGMRDILQATVHENVNLIKSIPQQYLTQVEGIVMRSVQTGRDLGQLSSDLQERFSVSKKRAALISRDQNNKATSAFQRVRQVEMGVEQAVWMHSHAGKKPRPTHVKMDGRRYDVKQGMWDPAEGRYIFPGELINCRCTSRSVIPGFV